MKYFLKIFALYLFFGFECLQAKDIQVTKVVVEPESQEEDVLASLPFNKGDVFQTRFVSITERLLKATEKFDSVEVEWKETEQEFFIRVIPRDYFDNYVWKGDRVADRSAIERSCLMPNESLNLSQERLSQINRCISGELQALGYLDAQVFINSEGKTLSLEVQLGESYTVQKIEIQGVSNSLQKILVRQLATEVGNPFYPLKVKGDTALILRNLLRRGNYFAEVYQPLLQVQPSDHTVSLSWKVTLGPRFDIRFLGEYLSPKPLDQMIEREETFPKWFLEEIQDIITGELKAEGYLDTEVLIRREKTGIDSEKIKIVTTKGKKYELLAPDLVGVGDRERVISFIKKFPELRAGSPFNRDIYKKTVNENLGSALFEAGYLDLQIRGIDFTIDKERARVRPVIYMSEGDAYRIREVKIEGLKAEFSDISEIKDFKSASRAGSSFNQPQLETLKTDLARAIVDLGFLDSKVDLSFEKSKGLVGVNLKIDAGLQYRVAQVLIRGAKRTKDRILRVEADIEVGDIYTDEMVREGVANILRLGIARSVDIRVLEKDAETGVVYVLIDIVEAARFRFEIGPGYGTLDGIRGIFKATYANIGGTGRRLSLFAKANLKIEESRTPSSVDVLDPREIPFIERRITLEYFEPRFLGAPVDGRLSFSNSKQDFPLFGLFKNTFSFALDYRYDRDMVFTTDYSLEYSDPFNVVRGQNIKAFDDERAKMLTSVSELAVFQFLDDNFNPIKGYRTRIYAALFHSKLGGDENFWQSTLKQDFYYPLFQFKKSSVLGLAVSGNIGFSDAMDPTAEVPVQKRYYLGGENSVRGFDDQAINPRNRVGGNSYFYFQSEINIPIFSGVDLLGFFDGGNLYEKNSDWRPWGLRWGAGGGLRWNTPVGPLKIGYGFNLSRHRIDGKIEPVGAFYFGVGVI